MSIDPTSDISSVSNASENGGGFDDAVDNAKNQDPATLISDAMTEGVSSVGLSYMMQRINDMKKEMKPVES